MFIKLICLFYKKIKEYKNEAIQNSANQNQATSVSAQKLGSAQDLIKISVLAYISKFFVCLSS